MTNNNATDIFIVNEDIGIRAAMRQAKELNKKKFLLKSPCKNNHLSPRYTSSGRCVICTNNLTEKKRAYKKDYYKKNKAVILKRAAKWRKDNAPGLLKK